MIRCKFYCESKTVRQHWNKEQGFLYDYNFNPVSGGSPENEAFWEATPGGSFKVSSVLSDAFEVGKAYYIDVTEAE
jgi:hypothetical protein